MKRRIIKAFHLQGLSLSKDATKALVSVLRKEPDEHGALEKILTSIGTRVGQGQQQSSVVGVDLIADVVNDLTKDDMDLEGESIQYFDSFSLPRLKYSSSSGVSASLVDASSFSRHAPADAKIDMFHERLVLLQERVKRNPLFQPPVLGSSKKEYVKLTAVESLRGTEGTAVMLGMLSQLEEGKWFLEDASGSVRLHVDPAQCTMHSGIFTERCVVLVEGELGMDEVFHVRTMGFPPPEARDASLETMAHLKYLGLTPGGEDFQHMRVLEKEAADAMFVVLSDVHIDRPEVMAQLKRMLEGFSSIVPSVFIFIGNFTSRPYGQVYGDREALAEHFDALGRLIGSFPALVEGSTFVFVPGPMDPGAPNVLPRGPLPDVFTRRIKSIVKNCVFASNPCRFRFYTQEIVVFRQNAVSKMRRHSAFGSGEAEEQEEQQRGAAGNNNGEDEDNEDEDNGLDMDPLRPSSSSSSSSQSSAAAAAAAVNAKSRDVTAQLCKTLIDQAHLCPLPAAVQPTYWDYDHALRLFPVPDVAILADYYDQYLQTYEDCCCLNPGSFPTDFSFVVYRPASRSTEFSRVP